MPAKVETFVAFPDPAETVAVLASAMRKRAVPNSRRVFATDDSQSVDEGLALLRCYVSIRDRRVRQAILDAVVTATDVDPHA